MRCPYPTIIKLISVAFLLIGAGNAVQGQKSKQEEKPEHMMVSDSLFNRIFPHATFEEKHDYHSSPIEKSLIGWYKHKSYRLPEDFNTLYSLMGNKQLISENDRIAAFLRSYYWNYNPKVQIQYERKSHLLLDGFTYNYDVRLTINGVPDSQRAILMVEDGEITRFRINCGTDWSHLMTPMQTRSPQSQPNKSSEKYFIVLSPESPYPELDKALGGFLFEPDTTNPKSPHPQIVTYFSTMKLSIPHDFNRLLAWKYKGDEVSTSERIKACIELYYWCSGSIPVIYSVKDTFIERSNQTYDYRVLANLPGQNTASKPLEFLVTLKLNQIAGITGYSDGEKNSIIQPEVLSKTADKYIYEQREITHPLLKKVFPRIKFTMEKGRSERFVYTVSAWHQSTLLNMPDEINTLLILHANPSASAEDRIESYFRLRFWPLDSAITILTQEPTNVEREGYTLNRRVSLDLHLENRGHLPPQEFLLQYERGQIIRVEEYPGTDYRDVLRSDLATPALYHDKSHPLENREAIQHPLIARTYPGVEFRMNTSKSDTNNELLTAKINGQTFPLPATINVLARHCNSSACGTSSDRLESFLRLIYWKQDPDLEITKCEPVNINRPDHTINNRIILGLNLRRRNRERVEVLLANSDDQIRRFEEYRAGRLTRTIKPIIVTDLVDRDCVGAEAIQFPALQQIFPDLDFMEESSFLSNNQASRMTVCADNRKLILPRDFSLLWKHAADSPSINMTERIEAFLRLFFHFENPKLQILSVEEAKLTKGGYSFDHLAHIGSSGDTSRISQQDWLISTIHGRIICAMSEDNARMVILEPDLVMSDSGSLHETIDTAGNIQLRLLDRIFPGVKFHVESISNSTDVIEHKITVTHKQKIYQMPKQFNELYSHVKNQDNVLVEERVLAYVWMAHFGLSPNAKLIEMEKTTDEKSSVDKYRVYADYRISDFGGERDVRGFGEARYHFDRDTIE